MGKLKELIERKRKSIFILIKAGVSSQISAWTDFIMSFVSFAWVGLDAKYAAAVGAIAGGVVNCCINYKWTFQAKDCSYRSVAVKYLLVWLGSFFFNVYGTEWFTNILMSLTWLDEVGMSEDVRFTLARLGVSLVVSLFWNLLLQRYFVFRNVGVMDKAMCLMYRLRGNRKG